MSDRLKEAFEALIEEMQEPPTWEEAITPAVRPVTSERRKRPVWVASAVVVAVLVFGVVSVLLTTDGSGFGPSDTVGPAELSSVDELQAAVRQSVTVLLGAPGIEFSQIDYSEGELAGSLWGESRSDGSFVNIEFTDLGAWNQESSSEEGVVIRARVQIGENLYTAGSGDDGVETPWQIFDMSNPDSQEGHSVHVAVPLSIMSEGSFLFNPDDFPSAEMEATRAETIDGGSLWTLTISPSEGSIVQEWELDQAGHLRFHSVVVDGLPEIRNLSVAIAFTPLDNPLPISPPEIGSVLDLEDFAIPPDLPLK